MEKQLLSLFDSVNNTEYQESEEPLSQTLSEISDFIPEMPLSDQAFLSILDYDGMDQENSFFGGSPDGKKTVSDLSSLGLINGGLQSNTLTIPFPEDSYANEITAVDTNSNDSMACVSMSEMHQGMISQSSNNITPTNVASVVTTRSHVRKASHTPRQASASPSFGSEYYEDDSNSSSTFDIKPDVNALSAAVANGNTMGKKRGATTNKNSAANSRGGGKIGQKVSKNARTKMYQSDDPKSKNAKLAHQNREKKKQEKIRLESENAELMKRIQTKTHESELLAKKVADLEARLSLAQRKNRAEGGLQRVFSTAKDIIETIMPPLIKKHGPFDIKTAPWFSTVVIPTDNSPICDTILANCAPTSSYITLNISTQDRLLHVDYNPEIPEFGKKTGGK